MQTDINQVKLRWTVSESFAMKTAKWQDRLTFSVQILTEYTDPFGDTNYSKTFVPCVAWWTAAQIFADKLKPGTQVQIIGELNTYTIPHKKDPSIILYKAEVRTTRIEVIGFDDTFKPRSTEKVEFSVVDDFSDLD